MTRRNRGKRAVKPITPEVSVPEVVMPEKTSHDQPALRDFSRAGTLKDVPLEDLAQAAAVYEKVAVNIRRRNSKGQLASLGYAGIVMTPDEVTRISEWIEPRAGGGVYAIDVTSTSDRYKKVVPSFEIAIESAPRPPLSVHAPVPAPGMSPVGVPAMQYDPTQPIPGAMSPYDIPRAVHASSARTGSEAWLAGLPHDQRAAYLAAQHPQVQLPPGASIASDQLAVEALRRAEARAAELEARLTAALQRSEERERQLHDALREEREKAREQMHQMEMRMLREQIAAGSNRPVEKSPVQEYVPLIAALAPVLQAMVVASKESGSKSLEIQQQGMQQLLGLIVAQGNKPQPDPLALVEKLTPILQLTQKDSGAQAAQMEAMGNFILQMTGMSAQLMESMAAQSAGDSTPAWLPVVQQIMGGVTQMVQGAQADQQRQMMMRQLPPQQQPPQVIHARPAAPPANAQRTAPAPAAPANVPYHTYSTEESASGPAPVLAPAPIRLNPAMLALLPSEFQSQEWKGIIIGLHEFLPAAEIGVAIARHVGHLDEFNMLPSVLADYHVDPPTSMRTLLARLPVYTANRAYCEEVIEQTVQAMLDHGILQLAEPEEGESEAEAPEQPDDVTVADGADEESSAVVPS